MNICYQGHTVKIVTHPHRSYDFDTYYQNHKDVIGWSDEFGCEAMLCSTSGYDAFDTWVWAQYLLEHSGISPYIAINPIYIHPFAAARKIFSLSKLYSRKIYINGVTGSAQADMNQLNDSIDHTSRYERLGEYMEVMRKLFATKGPISFDGKYYQIKQASLEGTFEDGLFPEITLAGESDVATQLCEKMNTPQMVMLPSARSSFINLCNKSVALGIIVRPTIEEAWQAAAALYPKDKFGQKLLKMSMMGNQTEWKERLNRETETIVANDFEEYWLEPFKNKYADCPYIVGGIDEIKQIITELCLQKVHSFVLTIKNREEFENIHHLFREVEKGLAS